MSDETIKIPPALRDRFEAEVKEAYKEHEEEFRRSIGIGAGFYEKLSALDAASIALAASIGMALIAKPELRSGAFHANIIWLAGIMVSLWVSLGCSVTHNFVFVRIAKLESAYSEDEFARTAIRRAFAIFEVANSAATEYPGDQLKQKAQEKLILQQQHNMRRRRLLYPWATALGYASMVSFLAAYALVVACVLRLWWMTR